jgi:hypothetical protein
MLVRLWSRAGSERGGPGCPRLEVDFSTPGDVVLDGEVVVLRPATIASAPTSKFSPCLRRQP